MGVIEIFIQVIPYLAVFAILGYIAKLQQNRAKKAWGRIEKGNN